MASSPGQILSYDIASREHLRAWSFSDFFGLSLLQYDCPLRSMFFLPETTGYSSFV